jgi:NTE family protein
MKLKNWISQDTFSLSLSAGFFGFYSHCGFVKALWERGFKPQKIVGTSAGALTGSLLCAGYHPDEIKKIITEIKREDVWDVKLGFGLLAGKKFRDHLSRYLPENFSDLKIPLSVSAFNLSKLKGTALKDGDLISAVQASCCFPMLFHPVSLEGTKFIDGGLTDWMGLGGIDSKERVLIHNLEPTGPGAPLMKVQIYKELKRKPESFVVQNSGLVRMGLTRMHLAEEAIEKAYQLTLKKLDQ